MKKIIFVISLCFIFNSLICEELCIYKTIEIDNNLDYKNLLDNSMFDSHIMLLYSNNKVAGKVVAIDFKDFILKYVNESSQKTDETLIRCTNQFNEKRTFTYAQINSDEIPLPVYLTIKEISGTLKDTTIIELDNQRNFETAKLEAEMDKIIDTKIKLLFNEKNDKIKPDFFKPGSLIFVSNKNTQQWMINIKKIELIYIKPN